MKSVIAITSLCMFLVGCDLDEAKERNLERLGLEDSISRLQANFPLPSLIDKFQLVWEQHYSVCSEPGCSEDVTAEIGIWIKRLESARVFTNYDESGVILDMGTLILFSEEKIGFRDALLFGNWMPGGPEDKGGFPLSGTWCNNVIKLKDGGGGRWVATESYLNENFFIEIRDKHVLLENGYSCSPRNWFGQGRYEER